MFFSWTKNRKIIKIAILLLGDGASYLGHTLLKFKNLLYMKKPVNISFFKQTFVCYFEWDEDKDLS